MSRQIQLNLDSFPCALTAAIVARRVVVFDGLIAGNVKLPTGANDKGLAGVTTEKQSGAGNVAVQTDGNAIVESDGSAVINPGDYVIYVTATGRVKTQAVAAGSANVYQIIGQCVDRQQIPATAGAIVTIRLILCPVIAA